MADGLEYLSPDFDLNSLTVPRLRSILVNHDIPYPASAKKAQLIQILHDEVLPQANRLLRERERVKRTSEGIMDMGSRESSVVSEADGGAQGSERESMPPPPTPSTASTTTGRRGRPKRNTRGSTVDTDDMNTPTTPLTASRRTSARPETRHSRMSDKEAREEARGLATPVGGDGPTPRRSTGRKLRSSEGFSSIEPDVDVKTEPVDENVFSDDNPFQSGSPAVAAEQQRRKTGDWSRKSGSYDPALKDILLQRGRKSATPSSLGKQNAGRYSTPLPSPKEESDEEEEDDEVAAGEEFTPDEQLALEREQADKLYPHNAQQRPRKQSTASKVLSWFVILSLLGSFGAWWRKEKIEMGFCGIGKPTWSLVDTNVPEWANVLEPRCEICPAHAFCYPNFEARCEHDFLLKPHPLSLGGLIPLPPTCEPDSEKARRVKAVADKAVEKLRDRRSKWECGQLTDNGKEAKSAEIAEPDLKQEIAKKRRKGMTDAEFDDLWKGALGEIIGKDEIISKTERPSSVLILSSTTFTHLPLTCAFRRYVRLSLLAYRLPLSILILFGLSFLYIRSRVRARRSDRARVPELVATTLDRLATQAALHARGDAHEPYIPIGQLRDDVLRSELQGRRREELWKRVRDVVEGNANIRAAVREGRGGDVSRVWEWIGGIGSVAEIESSAKRRESSRFLASSPEENRYQDTPVARSPIESRHWDEGRPIY
ncbi:sister chromatid separation protein [Aspergillus sclerotialis]|uniref:Sister chromatid separation protein n=1 Tax=Aspergillus sclerotialis TaxID=2070753 RepID=A0A3A3A900_9EURO|nr:sister chromatid separation protein [Aspergillus sclerotialis]